MLPLAAEKVSMDNGDDKGLPTGSAAALSKDCATPRLVVLDAKSTSRPQPHNWLDKGVVMPLNST